eukprot:4475393-Amphidinium_carterae.1
MKQSRSQITPKWSVIHTVIGVVPNYKDNALSIFKTTSTLETQTLESPPLHKFVFQGFPLPGFIIPGHLML